MVTAIDFSIIADLETDKYLSFISLQPGTVLFNDRWCGISVGVLNCDTFSPRGAPKQRKIILWKTNLRLLRILPQGGLP